MGPATAPAPDAAATPAGAPASIQAVTAEAGIHLKDRSEDGEDCEPQRDTAMTAPPAEWMYEQRGEWWPFDPEWRDQVEAAFQQWQLTPEDYYTTSVEWVEDGQLLGTPGLDIRHVKWQARFGHSGHRQRRLEEVYQGTSRMFKNVYERRIQRGTGTERGRPKAFQPY